MSSSGISTGVFPGQHAAHALHEHVPLKRPPKIVAPEETTASQVIAHLGGLFIGQVPLAGPHRVEHGPVVNVVFIVQIHRLFHRARVDPREAAEGGQKMTVGAGVILRPTGHAVRPSPAAGTVETRGGRRWIHQPRKHPFRRPLSAVRKREIVVLDGWVLAKLTLPRAQGSNEDRAARQQEEDVSTAHYETDPSRA